MDISTGIFRCNPSGQRRGLFVRNAKYFSDLNDIRRQYVLRRVDPRINLALSALQASSPAVRLYDSGVSAQLDSACRSYLRAHMVIDPQKQRLFVSDRTFKANLGDWGHDDQQVAQFVMSYLRADIRERFPDDWFRHNAFTVKFIKGTDSHRVLFEGLLDLAAADDD